MNDQFPKWMYHANDPAVIVNNEEELKNLGRGWHEEPVKGNTEVDQHSGEQVDMEPAELTGDVVFDQFLIDNGMDKVPAKYQQMIRAAYDHTAQPAPGQPALPIEAPRIDPQIKADEEKRRDLLVEAHKMGIKISHLAGIAKIQAAIDEKKAEDDGK